MRTILVVDTSLHGIKDIEDSLRMIDCKVISARTLVEAKRQILAERPAAVLTALTLAGDEHAGERLAHDLGSHESLKAIPVVALVPRAQEAPDAELLSNFRGVIELPVEFPVFTQRMQEILAKAPALAAPSSGSVKGGASEKAGTVLKLESAESKAAASNSEGEEPALVVRDHSKSGHVGASIGQKLLTVYSIQLAVMKELEAGTLLSHCAVHDVPTLVSDVTRKICQQLMTKAPR